eukprot:1686-Hanusia_phi.AAC.1
MRRRAAARAQMPAYPRGPGESDHTSILSSTGPGHRRTVGGFRKPPTVARPSTVGGGPGPAGSPGRRRDPGGVPPVIQLALNITD